MFIRHMRLLIFIFVFCCLFSVVFYGEVAEWLPGMRRVKKQHPAKVLGLNGPRGFARQPGERPLI